MTPPTRVAQRAARETVDAVTAGRSRWVVGLEAFAVTAFAALVAVLAARLLRGVTRGYQVPILALAGLGGYALADVASGLTHWFCDTFFQEDTPYIGRALIAPFREHHRDPTLMTHHGFLELTGNSCLGMLPILAVATWWPAAVYFDAGLLTFVLALFATNLFHSWAHAERVPGWVVWLQRRRLILSPTIHAIHHRPGNLGAYCVTNGWMNVVLDRALL